MSFNERVENCHQYNADGKCGRCYIGYELKDGKCVRTQKYSDTSCLSETLDGKCVLCMNLKTKDPFWPNTNGECKEENKNPNNPNNPNNTNNTNNTNNGNNGNNAKDGTIMTTLLFFVVVMMMLF